MSGKYEMPAEAVTLSKAWKVTLNGFTSVKTSDNAMTVTDGSYVADGKSLDYTTLPADKHVINTTDGSVAADAVLTSNVTVSADVELSAATQVEITSNIAKIGMCAVVLAGPVRSRIPTATTKYMSLLARLSW